MSIDAASLDEFVAKVADAAPGFYRSRWGGARTYAAIPAIGRDDFLAASLEERRYFDEGAALTKIVRSPEGVFLCEWTIPSIGRERYGAQSAHPVVFMRDAHEAIEKTMWCYEQNMLPLTAEGNPDVAAFAARKFRADSLLTDPQSLPLLEPYLRGRRVPMQAISVIGEAFDIAALRPFRRYAARLRLVLALSETGAFAEAEYADEPRFAAHPGVVLEHGERLVVTKTSPLLTPIIKYRTRLATRAFDAQRFVLA